MSICPVLLAIPTLVPATLTWLMTHEELARTEGRVRLAQKEPRTKTEEGMGRREERKNLLMRPEVEGAIFTRADSGSGWGIQMPMDQR